VTSNSDEVLDTVDETGSLTGFARRSELHRNPALIHRVVHVLVFDEEDRLLLQKRSHRKDVAPGKWDTSVGGHVLPAEEIADAARREMEEELGIRGPELNFLYRYLFSNKCESELVHTFRCHYGGPVNFNREEIDDVRFWNLQEILESLGKDIFSGHFEQEIITYLNKHRFRDCPDKA